jgi:predicted  nucleic acid-binding Zn-ribbon protein
MDEYERRTEELAQTQKELSEEQKLLTRAQKELTEAQKQTEANLSALMVIVADLGRAQLRTEQAITNLTERFDRNGSGS